MSGAHKKRLKKGKKPQRTFKKRPAFTLIELLISIGILGVLASVVIAAINIGSSLLRSYDTKRTHEAVELEKSLTQRLIDTGDFLTTQTIPTGQENAMPICNENTGIPDYKCISLKTALVPTYLAAIPQDAAEPPCRNYSGYAVYKDSNGRPHIIAEHKGKKAGEVTTDFCRSATLFTSSIVTMGAPFNITLPQFDPSLGTITEMAITFSGSHMLSYRVENTSPGINNTSYGLDVTHNLVGPSLAASLTNLDHLWVDVLPAYDGVTDYLGTSGRQHLADTKSESVTLTKTAPAELALYTGVGTVNLTASHALVISQTQDSFASRSISQFSRMKVTVVYFYDPA